MKDECFGVDTGDKAKQNPFCDVKEVVDGAHMALNFEYQQARRELAPSKFEVLKKDEQAWIKDVLTPTQKGSSASKYDELDVVNDRTKVVHDWRTAPKDVDGGDAVTPAEQLQKEVKDIEEKSKTCSGDIYDCIKQEQDSWQTVMNKAYAKLQEEGSLGEQNDPKWQLTKNLRQEQEKWEDFRDQSFATIDNRFGIDETKPGQTEREVSHATHNVGPAVDKAEIVKERAKHLVNFYDELTGPGE